MKDSCYGCVKRMPKCHSKCKIYKEWKKNLYKNKPASDHDFKNFTFDSIYRAKGYGRWI